jgi:succinoglycan biosynthesis protein ExoM
VTVALCTFRRPALLRAALESVTAQVLPDGTSLGVLIIDNDDQPTAREAVERHAASSTVPVRYLHVPGRNISIARNAALDDAVTRWLVFIDDDEYASPDWLAALLAARHGAGAVFGPCQAIYPDGTPGWIRRGDYHSNRLPFGRPPIDTGYTANVLIDVEFLRRTGLRFDEVLGRTGGEDALFFHAMYRKGAALKYAEAAVVYEKVVAERVNLRWIVHRRFRVGQTYALMFQRHDGAAYLRIACSAPLKIMACLAMATLTSYDRAKAGWWLMRAVFHGGAASYALGKRVYEEYGTPA